MDASAGFAKQRSATLRKGRWIRYASAVAIGIVVFTASERVGADIVPPTQPPPALRCPRDTAPDEQRSDSVMARLRANESGAALLARLGRALIICYGDVREGVLQSDNAMVLQRDLPIAANAARLGHLVFHLVHGAPFDEAAASSSSLSCAELVKRAAAMERQAYALEDKLRKSFGLPPQAFEDLSALYERRCRSVRRQ